MADAKPGVRKHRANVPLRADTLVSPLSLGDEALLEGVSSGSEPHFNALYARHFGRIYAFVHARAANRSDTEELTQEVFTVVFTSAGGYGDRASPLSWIYGIARNTLLNYIRRRQLDRERAERIGSDVGMPPPPDWSYTPEEQCRQARLHAELERRMATLAQWQLEVFRLRHFENLPIEEISRRTTRSGDAVRSGLYRAKRMLFDAADLAENDE